MHAPRALARAARVLVRTALKLRFGERLVVVQDSGSDAIGAAIADAADEAGAWVKRARLNELSSMGGGRPHKTVPERLVLALQQAHASVFVASGAYAEATMRQEMLHLVREFNLRHAHMPGITEASFLAGLTHDVDAVARVGREVLRRLETARSISAYSPAGTELRVDLAEGTKWVAQLGELVPGSWGNFPAGALYTSPECVSGVFVADASLGEFFGAREGLLAKKPVRFFVEEGKIVRFEHEGSRDLTRDLEAMLAFSANSARIGLLAIGVNYGVAQPIGDAVVDQTSPGLHLGIGDPAGKATGAAWSAPTCFAACEAGSRVVIDGQVLIDGGKLRGPSKPPKRHDSGTHVI